MRQLAPVHYLRPNHAEWSPPAVIFLDTEAVPIKGAEPQILALRCWVADYLDRRNRKGVAPREETGKGTTADQLAAWITSVTRNRECVWLYCHNLAFDLVTTRLPITLTAAGWRIHDAAIGGRAPWLTMGKGKRVLTLADSGSWLPMPLEKISHMVKIAKPQLPAERDTLASWLARCTADVRILRAAMLELMGWWDAEQLGRWQISGAASGWNAYRHKPAPVQVLIDPDPAKVKRERDYVHGGRRATWTTGHHAAGPFVEVDFRAAYPTIAAHLPLPYSRARSFDSMPLHSPLIDSERWGLTARCRIRTEVPGWPVRVGRRTWYPVGEFDADLAGPDIRAAAEAGVLVSIGPGSVHRLGHAMLPWARWVLDVQNDPSGQVPDVVRAVARHWGRAVLGKWSTRAYERIKLGASPAGAWGYEDGWHHDKQCPAGVLDLAGERWLVSASGDPDNAYPAIYAWVEAEVRTRLNRLVAALGEGCVLQADTDGVILAARTVGTAAAKGSLVAPDGLPWQGRLSWCLARAAALTWPLEPRQKASHAHVTILGPQHVQLPASRSFAGLPGMHEPIGGDQYRGRLWPKLQWQLANGDPRGYVRPETTVTMRGPWPTGWILEDGTVVPVQARIGRDGATQLVAWHGTRYAAEGKRAGPVQSSQLADLW